MKNLKAAFNRVITVFLASQQLICFGIYSQDSPPAENPKQPLKEEAVTTDHVVKINGKDLAYKATVGTQLLCDDKCVTKAAFFYVAYTKEEDSAKSRPITFCFNGGPGSAAVWLHLGAFGPKRIAMDKEGMAAQYPLDLVDNPYSILDLTDLVFIDPISTGYSRAVDDPKPYHGVQGDVESIANFIRLYTTRNNRWESPKYLAGESYGTTRAASLALELHEKYFLYVDGIILLSTVLNYQTIYFTHGNDLSYILTLPSYTQAALYHKLLAPELQNNPQRATQEAEQFAIGEYATALMLGDKIDAKARNDVLDKLSQYTGLSKEYLDKSDLRVPSLKYIKTLLGSQGKIIGRMDARVTGFDLSPCGENFGFDPSLDNILGPFTAALNSYVRGALHFSKDEEYRVLADVKPWDYSIATNQYLDVGVSLREVIIRNPVLKVFVANGMTDLATPYFCSEYTFTHLGLPEALRQNITLKRYIGGHMMYLYEPSLIQLKSDLSQFYK